MSSLILVKHSLSEIIFEIPAEEWQLSDEGRRRCTPLAERLRTYKPDFIYTSSEPKALETAQRVSETLHIPMQSVLELHEHSRRTVGFFKRHAEFEAAVAEFFSNPDGLVLGEETAAQAQQRFSQAIYGALEQHPKETLVVVTHGTVITLFVTQACGVSPFPFWKNLGLPSVVVLSLPEIKLLSVIEEIR